MRYSVLVLAIVIGCGPGGREPNAQRVKSDTKLHTSGFETADTSSVRLLREIADGPPISCFALDSLAAQPIVFADMSEDSLTGDIGGIEMRFLRGPGGGFAALFREASGGLPTPQPVDSLAYDGAADTLTVWWSALSNSYVYRLKPACDNLTGVGTFWITEKNPAGQRVDVILPRTLTPMPERR